jgi:pyrroline-5-carboxylate reductase
MTNTRIAVLGAGNMGRALLGGLLRSGTRPEHLGAGEAAAPARERLARELGINASADNHEAIAGAAVVVLAVKPQEAAQVLTPLAGTLRSSGALLVSVAAGVRIATLESLCGPGVCVVRAMPNRPALIGAGVTGLYAPPTASTGVRCAAERVMRAVGEVVWVAAEEALDVVTALSGSGPAYFLLLAELLADAGEQLGLEATTARRLAAVTLYGTGLLTQSGEGQLAQLRAEVASPGGTTEAALRKFEAAGLRATVLGAVRAAAERARELARAGSR